MPAVPECVFVGGGQQGNTSADNSFSNLKSGIDNVTIQEQAPNARGYQAHLLQLSFQPSVLLLLLAERLVVAIA